ncbi:MAG TPA: polyhydroxyalkanoate synthesis regulator DNA-binding domain-containing protein [Syntrophales bacterium]|nr:polyhydroxyalkanoate synthesis regulator DNA-binding domain-containing protein [Syntrophales bacterium]HOX93722.1 polyhydroxyalkanoate synthesis regulator DNA-binding domain-containing protein [Syntrophales bacterium]HPI57067.1 polyhydroxyalkanoate synthesis regulator DNA-binding domain-containing protein [Syntrophales bacterium]HPN23803.1 polyhydroxyalkanoate synthesis regulator DNA-binding domain-containing protein [Syntrophales bacterium]HQM30126.1 polyhydroxyalkanoate synthesis regulator
MPERILLKKYANRRLYDTEKNTYITLGQVADMIREGRQVKVEDAKTHEDVTAYILTQVVLEEAKSKNILLPVPLLHLFIQYGDTVLSEFFDKYLQQIIRNYLSYKTSVDSQFSKWLDVGMNLTGATKKAMTDLQPYRSIFDIFSPPVEDPTKKEKK